MLDLVKNRSTLFISLVFSLYFSLAFNSRFFDAVLVGRSMDNLKDYLFLLGAFAFLFAIVNLFVSILAFRHTFKPWLTFLLITAALATYFVKNYGVIVDYNMMTNVAETDYREASELLSLPLALHIFLFGILPAALLWYVPVKYAKWNRELLNKGIAVGLSTLLIGSVAAVYYQDYASLLRNDRQIRNHIVPLGYLYATYSYAKHLTPETKQPLAAIGRDAKRGPAWQSSQKKVVTLLIVGETARAENFSLSGYTRDTNPGLRTQNIIYFDNFHSCGTATAVSLPCMFSQGGQDAFDDKKVQHTENLLDVFKHAGVPVLWRDNNSGCKGICQRVDYESVAKLADNPHCRDNECFDMVLLDNLKEKIDSHSSGSVIVLHQKGSHGPAYYARVPEEARHFKPYCTSSQLQDCSREEIVNAYDNTIAYTDYFLTQVIEFLKQHEAEYDASLVYVSDHGESLGENGLYLHGIPYMIAPSQQTHVPFFVWMSDSFAKRFQIQPECLALKRTNNYTHDNLFSSMLGLLDVQTTAYDPNEDIFHSCKGSGLLTAQKQNEANAESTRDVSR